MAISAPDLPSMTATSGSTDPFALASQAADEVNHWAGGRVHDVAIVLGSGWQGVADGLGSAEAERSTSGLPGFVAPTVAGHHGELRSLSIGDHRVLLLIGRVHLYEGRSPAEVVHPVRTAVIAGARVVILTNAAGGLDPAMRPGQAVLIRDHLNLTGASPLSGPPPPEGYRGRFVDLTELYPAKLRALAKSADPTLSEGVYAGLNGPQYETPAEVAMLRKMGADLVGMSTTLEAIAAHHLGASVLGISLVTNLAAGVSPTPLDHAEVLAAGTAAAPYLARLIAGVLAAMTAGHEGTEPIPADLLAEAEAWMAADPDPATRAELAALIQAGDSDALRDRFERPLTFGTAGLRGELGAGPARMNRLVVRKTTAGVARWVLDQGAEAARRGIVVGRDARHGSEEFAGDTAAVASAAGVHVREFSRPLPTPLTAFAVKHFGAAGGVMVTASHNPAVDNGYKVYAADGAQVIPPDDAHIAEAAAKAPASAIAVPEDLASEQVELIDEAELLEAYRRRAFAFLDPAGARQLRIVYTPLHGVGGAVVPALLESAGFGPVSVVAAQGAPDPDFPTLAFPNPEEPGALDLAFSDAVRLDADIVIANDPDADRLAIGVPDPETKAWRRLTGDEVGVLLGDHVLRITEGDDRLVATTIVSSTMLSKLAAAAGVAYVETLTGFKWIARAALRRPGTRLVFGYEEALGYVVGDAVSDKDGLSAALVAAEIAATAKVHGTSLLARLDDLACLFGVHVTGQWSLRLSDSEAQDEMAQIVDRWRAEPPTKIAGLAVREVVDLSRGTAELPPTDGLILRLEEGARVVLRPSGTEPKLKVYFEVATGPVSPEGVVGERHRVEGLLSAIETEVAARCQSISASSPKKP